MKTALSIFADFDQVDHVQGPGHPERPERLAALRALLDDIDLAPVTDSPVASRNDLLTVHTPEHVDRLLALDGKSAVIDPDTRVGPSTIGAARSAVGCGLAAVDAVMSGDTARAFAIVRPPGHHAEADQAMGFCYFNTIAIMAEAARNAGAERVLVVDWDVHHGNGTQHSFESRADVAVVNLHQSPLFPGSGLLRERGDGDGLGFTVNCPMGAGAGDADYLVLFDEIVAPFARRYEPELILVSAGYDAHALDPLGGMRVSDSGFGQMAVRLRRLADELCGGRLAATLEGGYDIDGLTGGVDATIIAWRADEPAVEELQSDSRDVADLLAFHRETTLS